MAAKTTKVQFVTNKVRFSFVHVFEPAETLNGAMKYSTSILIPKSDKEGVAAFNKALEQCKTANTSYFGGTVPKNLKVYFRDGDEEKDDPIYAGHYFFSALSSEKPGVFDENANAILDKSDFYSGCYGKASITMYPYDVSGTKGIAFGLNAVKKLEEGEKLGGSVTTAAVFD